MKKSVTVALERPARKSGGDRYKEVEGSYTTYIPQTTSRVGGVPLKKIKITFEEVK